MRRAGRFPDLAIPRSRSGPQEPVPRPDRLRRVLLLVLLTTAAFGCAGRGGPGTGPALRVGVSPDRPPVVFEQDGEIIGIEADLARGVAEALGRRLVFERRPFDELIPALERGEIDVVMSGLTITPERAARVRFVAPWLEVGQLALIRARDLARFGRVHQIRRADARVGYERNTEGERFVAEMLPRARSFAFDDVESGLRSLRAGRIDYFVHDAPTIWRLAGDPAQRDLHGLYHPLTEERLAWAVRLGDESLARQLETTLADWKRQGLIEPIVDRWIPVRITLGR